IINHRRGYFFLCALCMVWRKTKKWEKAHSEQETKASSKENAEETLPVDEEANASEQEAKAFSKENAKETLVYMETFPASERRATEDSRGASSDNLFNSYFKLKEKLTKISSVFGILYIVAVIAMIILLLLA